MSSSPIKVTTAAALVIGNELLSGKIADGNLQPLARTLRARGVRLVRANTIADNRALIAAEINVMRKDVDLLVTSGGIGPTHDDVTVEAVADAFGVGSNIHPELAQMLREVYRERLTDAHLRMALVPDGATLRFGLASRWPAVAMGNVWMLPGIPELFRARLATLKEHIVGTVEYHSQSVLLNVDEVELKPLLDQTVSKCPSVEIGSYPKLFSDQYKTQITFDGEDEVAVNIAHDAFLALLPEGVLPIELPGS